VSFAGPWPRYSLGEKVQEGYGFISQWGFRCVLWDHAEMIFDTEITNLVTRWDFLIYVQFMYSSSKLYR
jgi:hypothetical protein